MRHWWSVLALGCVGWASLCAAQPFAQPKSGCATIQNLSSTNDHLPLWASPISVQVRAAWCTCTGTCTTPATITFEDGAQNAITGTVTCGTAAAPGALTPLAGAATTLVAREQLGINVTNTPNPDGADYYTVCWTYQVVVP